MKKYIILLYFMMFYRIAYSQSNNITDIIKQQDRLFNTGKYTASIKQIEGLSAENKKRKLKQWQKKIIYNSTDNDLIHRSFSDHMEAHNKDTEFIYYPQDKQLVLQKTSSIYKDRLNWLFGTDSGACLSLGRGVSRLKNLKIKNDRDKFSISGNIDNLFFEGELSTGNQFALSKVIITSELNNKEIEWECREYSKYNNAVFCSKSISKNYDRFQKIDSIEEISIINFEFNKIQNLDILNKFSLKEIHDNRFGETVIYDDLPAKIDFKNLTKESQKESKSMSDLLNEHQEIVDKQERGLTIYRIIQIAVILATIIGLFFGVRILKKRKLNSIPTTDSSQV
jgi:hypothetical protein